MESRREAASRILRGYGRFLKQQESDYGDVKSSDLLSYERPKSLSPVDLTVAPFERLPVADAVDSDNAVLNKIVAVFSIISEEVVRLRDEADGRHFVFLAFYAEHFKSAETSPEEFVCGRIADLFSLTAFVKRCHEVVSNLCNQLVALYDARLINLKGAKLDYILGQLGDVLIILITVECLVNCSPIQSHWTGYRKVARSLSKNAKVKNSKSIESVLDSVENTLFSDKIIQNCFESSKNIKGLLNKNNYMVADDFIAYTRKLINELERATVDYAESTISSVQWIKANALFVYHFHVFGSSDKKLFRNLTDVNLKAHTIPLYGLSVWHPEQFLLRHVTVLCTSPQKMTQSLIKARQTYIANKKQNLLKDVYNAQVQSTKWALELIQTFSTGEAQLNVLNMNHRLELLMQGVAFASQINYTVTSFMNIHISHNMSITKSSLLAICKLIEILKGMQLVFKDNFISIASSINLIIQHLLFQIITQLSLAKKKFMSDKNYTSHLDELTAVVIAERSLRGPPTVQRRIVGSVALSVVPPAAFPDDGHLKIAILLEKLDTIINIHKRMKSLCYCLFLYWHKSVIPIYLPSIFLSKKDTARFTFIISAMNDCSETINKYERQQQGVKSIHFHNEIEEYINDAVIKPLGQQIETNLRLQVHSHLQLDSMNPFIVPVEDNLPLLSMRHFQLNNSLISITNAVEHYLSYMFYNLTTVVLHDWKTYGEMRQLAKFKFNLTTVEDHLPTQTLEQGLDVLEIMRNIPVFVSKYLYNLNNQIFVEQNSNNKYLNTIGICHIANSIRTHGTGIMNTTVNFTYQFLKKKFLIFSQFMYDEQIKSRLIKDVRTFREASSVSEPMYGYKRAEKFNKSIRNLGLNEEGKTYLDLFRMLISHIGNAMGYVRMVRSGGLHCCANAATFLPSLDESAYGFLLKTEEDADALVKEAFSHLNSTVSNLTSQYSQGTDYFKLLVEAFAPVFKTPDQAHLKTFYMIIPPLTINFVENMLLSKDKMSKKNKTGASFTDDGFAMGLAYVLKLLDQDENMDSLNWFKSVSKHISEERKSIAEQTSTSSDHLHHALALTEKKLNLLEQEFQLLYFSFSSARIFFQ